MLMQYENQNKKQFDSIFFSPAKVKKIIEVIIWVLSFIFQIIYRSCKTKVQFINSIQTNCFMFLILLISRINTWPRRKNVMLHSAWRREFRSSLSTHIHHLQLYSRPNILHFAYINVQMNFNTWNTAISSH